MTASILLHNKNIQFAVNSLLIIFDYSPFVKSFLWDFSRKLHFPQVIGVVLYFLVWYNEAEPIGKGGMTMKRMVFLFFAMLFLLCGCGVQASVTDQSGQTETDDFLAQDNFKCYVEFGETKHYLDRELAQELSELITYSIEAHAFEPEQLPSDSVRLVFYNSEQDFPFNEDYESCEDYTVYSDGTISKEKPSKMSAPFYYEGTAELYGEILGKLKLPK